jgi:hypothetical protein
VTDRPHYRCTEYFARLGIDQVDALARKARDRFIPLVILFMLRDRIADNPALDPEARRGAQEENRWHPNNVGPPVQALIDIGQAARLQAASLLGSRGCSTVKLPLTSRLPGAALRRAFGCGS